MLEGLTLRTIYPKKEHDELIVKFDQLQTRLVTLWQHIGRSDPGSQQIEHANTVLVIPSLTVELKFDIASQQAYEERMLFMLFLLQQPNIRLIYLSSLPVAESIINYYLDVMPRVSVSNARKRLYMLSPGDASDLPLIRKILDRKKLIEHIRSMVPDPDKAHIVPFLTTDLERDLSVQLGIPMYAADPQYVAFGTKTGCREIFSEEGVPHPLGAQDLHSLEDLVRAVSEIRKQKPGLSRMIVKQNNGVSGYGNAALDLEGLDAAGGKQEKLFIQERLRTMKFEMESLTYDSYISDFEKYGGIVEELVAGDEILSPSAQLRITPLGEVQQLSTHDQMLGGPTGQTFLGARFPANAEYGAHIMAEAMKIGRRLAREGIVGRFAVDFIIVRTGTGGWEPFAIEINLRKGGTTHPFLTLQYLTDGTYDSEQCVFRTKHGREKYYIATDNVKSPDYKVFTPEDLFDIISQSRLHFDHTTQTGIVLHMISSVSTHGRLGFTAIGDSHVHAQEIYQEFVDILGRAANSYRD